MITAYRLTESTSEQLEEDAEGNSESDDSLQLEEGVMVRVDEEAVSDAGIDEADENEEFDDEYNYEQYGFVMEIHEDDFRWYDEEEDEAIDVEVDGPVYIVGMAPLEAGAHPFEESVLTPVDADEIMAGLDIDPDPDEAEEEMYNGDSEDEGEDADEEDTEENAYARIDDPFDLEMACEELEFPEPGESTRAVEELTSASNVPGITRNQMGLSPWPYSWRNSNKPARLIAMDAWLSMGRSFRGCRRSVVGNIRNPNRFCAAFKDAIYGHTYWREGGG